MRADGTGGEAAAQSAALTPPRHNPATAPAAPCLGAGNDPHLGAILGAETAEAVLAALSEALRPFGFDRFLYGLARFLVTDRLGAAEDLYFASTLPEAYTSGYFDAGLFRHAPMLDWARRNTGAMSWDWACEQAAAGQLSPQALSVLEFNRRHGVIAGYTLCFADLPGEGRGVFGLCAAPGLDQAAVDRLWQGNGSRIAALAHVAHLRLIALARPPLSRPLSDRQREVLEWVANGKSVADISDILGIRPATVEKHLRLARETLRAGTTAQAAVKAALLNQIFIGKATNEDACAPGAENMPRP